MNSAKAYFVSEPPLKTPAKSALHVQTALRERFRSSNIPPLFMHHDPALLRSLAEKVGTPFWLYDARVIRERIAEIRFITREEGIQPRYAMKACPATRVLREMKEAGIWIDAVSGNEVLRAITPATRRGISRR
jgi:hypothetical protein